MSTQTQRFDNWCIVELFGHSKIAGKCTEENIAGTNMLRVDVPETSIQPPFTKYYGSAAIYAINPVDETTAKMAAESIQQAPVQAWQGEAFTEKFLSKQRQLPDMENDKDEMDEDEMDGDIF